MARMRILLVFLLAVTAGGALAFGTYNYMQQLPAQGASIPTRTGRRRGDRPADRRRARPRRSARHRVAGQCGAAGRVQLPPTSSSAAG